MTTSLQLPQHPTSDQPARGATPKARARGLALTAAAILFTALAGGGCSILPEASADPTRYYVFDQSDPSDRSNPSDPSDQSPASVAADSRGVTVAIRSIELPAYLRNSKSMVVRVGENEVRYEDYSRWAEPIDAGIQRVIKERLANAEGVTGVLSFPLTTGETRQMDLRIRVVRCEGSAPRGGQAAALFVASYQVFNEADGKRLLHAHFTAPALAWDGRDFGELARQLSQAATLLADDIAKNLPQR